MLTIAKSSPHTRVVGTSGNDTGGFESAGTGNAGTGAGKAGTGTAGVGNAGAGNAAGDVAIGMGFAACGSPGAAGDWNPAVAVAVSASWGCMPTVNDGSTVGPTGAKRFKGVGWVMARTFKKCLGVYATLGHHYTPREAPRLKVSS